MKKAVVLGAERPLGAQVAVALSAAGHVVRAVVRPGDDDTRFPERVQVVRGLPWLAETIARHSASADVLFDCTQWSFGANRIPEPDDVRRQLLASVNGARIAGVRRVVRTSASLCELSRSPDEPAPHGHPTAVAAAICAGETEALRLGVHGRGVEVVSVAPTVVLGGDPRSFEGDALMLLHLLDPLRTTYEGGGNLVALADVVAAHLLLAERGRPGGRYVAGGENITWRAFHGLLAQMAGESKPIITAHDPVAHIATGLAAAAGAGHGQPGSWQMRDPADRAVLGVSGAYDWYDDRSLRALGYRPSGFRATVLSALGPALAAMRGRK